MSDFSENLASRLQAKREEEKLRAQKAIQDTSILNRGFTTLWERVGAAIQALCDDINNTPRVGVRLICTQSGTSMVIARTDAKETLKLTADSKARIVRFTVVDGPSYDESYSPKLTGSQTDYYLVDKGNVPTTVEQMCMRAVEAYLGVPR